MTTQQSHTQTPGREVVIGVVADPVATPLQVAQQLEQELPRTTGRAVAGSPVESRGAP